MMQRMNPPTTMMQTARASVKITVDNPPKAVKIVAITRRKMTPTYKFQPSVCWMKTAPEYRSTYGREKYLKYKLNKICMQGHFA